MAVGKVKINCFQSCKIFDVKQLHAKIKNFSIKIFRTFEKVQKDISLGTAL
jgi:hypothetical protein